jgi:hypothetical protein
MSLGKLRRTKVCASLLAACVALAVSPGQARAEHEGAGTVALVGLMLGHGQLIPAYLSTGYYAYASDEPMPIAWTTMNCITGTAAGTLGVAMMAAAAEFGETDHGPRENNAQILLGFYGGVTLAAGVAVSVISIMQATRDPDAPKREKKEQGILVLPTAGVSDASGTTAGLSVAGVF